MSRPLALGLLAVAVLASVAAAQVGDTVPDPLGLGALAGGFAVLFIAVAKGVEVLKRTFNGGEARALGELTHQLKALAEAHAKSAECLSKLAGDVRLFLERNNDDREERRLAVRQIDTIHREVTAGRVQRIG